MASPYAAYFAGIGTVVAALAVGFGGGLFLTSPSPSQKEQRSAYEKRVEARFESKREKPAEPANPESANTNTPVSPIMAAALAPDISTTFSPPAAPAPWPPAASEDTAQETPKLAPDPGALQPPLRPAAPLEAAAPPPPVQAASVPAQSVAKSRSIEPNGQRVIEPSGQGTIEARGQNVPDNWKYKEKRNTFAQDSFAQKKTRKQIVVEQAKPAPVDAEQAEDVVETRTITTYAPEPRPPLGIFNLLLGGGN